MQDLNKFIWKINFISSMLGLINNNNNQSTTNPKTSMSNPVRMFFLNLLHKLIKDSINLFMLICCFFLWWWWQEESKRLRENQTISNSSLSKISWIMQMISCFNPYLIFEGLRTWKIYSYSHRNKWLSFWNISLTGSLKRNFWMLKYD